MGPDPHQQLADPPGRDGPHHHEQAPGAKCPHLIPIQESVVTALLYGGGRSTRYWGAWRERLPAEDGPALIEAAASIRDEVPDAAHLSVLRILDIVLWRAGR